MNIAVLDDYQDTIRSLACFSKVAGHNVTIWKDHTKDVGALAGRLKGAEVLALIRERTPITAPLLDRLPALRLICQAGVVPHIDLEACTRHGVIVSSNTAGGRPSYATAELTWGLIIAAFRRIPQEMAALTAGRPGRAAVDVYEDEPVVGGRHPLLAMDNVVSAPHLGYVERDGLEHMFSNIFDEVLAYAAGKPINVLNPDVLEKGAARR